jgi:hypothetical protein
VVVRLSWSRSQAFEIHDKSSKDGLSCGQGCINRIAHLRFTIMAGHNFVAPKWTPSAERWNSVPGLAAKLALPDLAVPCANGCGYNLIPSASCWVDFGRGILQIDTTKVDCDRAKSAGSAAAAGASAPSSVRHIRPDFAQTCLAIAPTSFGPRPDIVQYDERLMAKAKDEFKQRVISNHQLAVPNFRQGERRFTRQGMDVVIALINAIYLESCANDALKAINIDSKRAVRGSGRSAKTPVGTILSNALVILTCMRGLMERVDHLALVQSQIFTTCRGMEFMNAMFQAMGDEYAILRDCVEKPEKFLGGSLVQCVEGTASFALGSAVLARDESAIRAFFRTELAREEAAAKKAGWKPPAPSASGAGAAASTAAVADAAAVPSPVVKKSKGKQHRKGARADIKKKKAASGQKRRRTSKSQHPKAKAADGSDESSD